MNTQKHTPEPWTVAVSNTWPHGEPELKTKQLCIHGGNGQPGFDGNIIAPISPEKYVTPVDRANAARIVSCVNACAGINPEAVPALHGGLEILMNVTRLLCDEVGVDLDSPVNVSCNSEALAGLTIGKLLKMCSAALKKAKAQ